jgi:DNA repair protein RecO (recombination protein O)
VNVLKTRAIVLRRTNYGEADRVLQLITPEGKKSVIAKGVRREKSRLSGGIELFAISEAVINQGKGELGVLTSSKLIKFYDHIMDDYDRMQFAYTVIKLISKASENTTGPEWYDILAGVLSGLNSRSMRLEMVQTWFYLHYAAVLGYELSLWHDENGQELSPDSRYDYDVDEKGFRVSAKGALTSEHIKLLRLMATKPLNVLANVGGVERVLSDCLVVTREHAAI